MLEEQAPDPVPCRHRGARPTAQDAQHSRQIFNLYAGWPACAGQHQPRLINLIETERVGRVCTDQSVDSLERPVSQLVDDIKADTEMPGRCKALSSRLFARETVVRQITAALAR